jgi:hypothetical protein
MKRGLSLLLSLFVLISASLSAGEKAEEPLLTVAEKSEFRATSRHAEVVAFCERLANLSPFVRVGELGTSFEGRKLPLLILADPPVASAFEARRSNKLVVYAQGNIHAGEVDGKEALMMLARDLAIAPERPLLKNLIIVFAPIFNADGNERMSKKNRPGQKGPVEGMGVRQNAQGFDLNRDFVKLESPEVQALVRFCNQWDPAVVIDTHTTNGSYHRYFMTYEGPRIPAGDEKLISMVRDTLFPDVGRRLEKRSGYKSFFYGNFSRDRTRWEPVPATPRYGTLYVGLRNRIGILSESYSYAPYRDRIFGTRDFVRSILEYVAENEPEVAKLLRAARERTIRAGENPRANDLVAVRQKAMPLDRPATLLGFVEEEKNGKHIATDTPHEYQVQYMGRCEPTLSVKRPYAYLLPASHKIVIENLRRHGIELEEMREDCNLDVGAYRTVKLTKGPQSFQKHRLVSVEAEARAENRRVPTGTIVIRTGQSLGALAIYLLEPQSEDGLCTWNFFDDVLAEGVDYPALRILKPVRLVTQPLHLPMEGSTREAPKPSGQ